MMANRPPQQSQLSAKRWVAAGAPAPSQERQRVAAMTTEARLRELPGVRVDDRNIRGRKTGRQGIWAMGRGGRVGANL